MKRASRTGPSAVMKDGTKFLAPSSVASATCGLGTDFCGLFRPGLVPPIAGWAWHIVQLLPLNVGPSPPLSSPAMVPDTDWTSWKRPSASLKTCCSPALRPANAPPAPAAPERGPGSTPLLTCTLATGSSVDANFSPGAVPQPDIAPASATAPKRALCLLGINFI